MYKAYKFRLYPNDEQRILIHKTFGCTGFVYNYFLDKCKSNGYKNYFAKRSSYPTFKNRYSK